MTAHATLAGTAETDRPCQHCHWFSGSDQAGNARCMYEGRLMVMSQPERGCVHWLREVGADDDAVP